MNTRRSLVPTLLGLLVLALPGAPAAFAANHNVSVGCCSFVPSYLEITEGDTVTWTLNVGEFLSHTVTNGRSSAPADSPGTIFDSTLAPGGTTTFMFTFGSQGNFPYFCRPHEFNQMKGTIVVRCLNPDNTFRPGNVDTGAGGAGPVDVLTVNGSAGAGAAREVLVTPNTNVSIGIAIPPQGGQGLYAIWRFHGEPCAGDATATTLTTGAGTQALGTAALCLPVNNTTVPGSCPCARVFGPGFTSRAISGAPTANALCLHRAPADPVSPTTLTTSFPAGIYTVTGLVVDRGSASGPKRVSLTNSVIVIARP